MKFSELLNEHYINVDSSSEKKELIDQIWPMLEKTYSDIGGLMGATKENLISTPGIWKLDRKNGSIISGILYKNLNGRKLRLVFSDSTTEGKNSLKKILYDDIFMKRSWGEFSGPLASVLIKMGSPIIKPEKLIDLIGVEPLSINNDGSYEREIFPGVIKTQILLGNPK